MSMKTKNWNFVVSFFIILVALLVVARVQAVEVTATVSVGSFPSGIVYDSGKGEMFVANYGNNTVSVISDCSNTVISTIKVGIEPQGIAYDSIKGEIFWPIRVITRSPSYQISTIQ